MRLGIVLRKYRTMQGLGVRELARQIGISFQVLHRVETGRNLDAANFMKVLKWLVEEER